MEVMKRLEATLRPDVLSNPDGTERQVDITSPDIVVREPESLPHGGVHRGVEEYRALQASMRELWEQTMQGFDYWPCGDDKVALRIVFEWKARTTGKSVVLPMIDLIRFEDGRMVEVEVFLQDTKALLDTLVA
jgi:ketosteroid isomerase-like protein